MLSSPLASVLINVLSLPSLSNAQQGCEDFMVSTVGNEQPAGERDQFTFRISPGYHCVSSSSSQPDCSAVVGPVEFDLFNQIRFFTLNGTARIFADPPDISEADYRGLWAAVSTAVPNSIGTSSWTERIGVRHPGLERKTPLTSEPQPGTPNRTTGYFEFTPAYICASGALRRCDPQYNSTDDVQIQACSPLSQIGGVQAWRETSVEEAEEFIGDVPTRWVQTWGAGEGRTPYPDEERSRPVQEYRPPSQGSGGRQTASTTLTAFFALSATTLGLQSTTSFRLSSTTILLTTLSAILLLASPTFAQSTPSPRVCQTFEPFGVTRSGPPTSEFNFPTPDFSLRISPGYHCTSGNISSTDCAATVSRVELDVFPWLAHQSVGTDVSSSSAIPEQDRYDALWNSVVGGTNELNNRTGATTFTERLGVVSPAIEGNITLKSEPAQPGPSRTTGYMEFVPDYWCVQGTLSDCEPGYAVLNETIVLACAPLPEGGEKKWRETNVEEAEAAVDRPELSQQPLQGITERPDVQRIRPLAEPGVGGEAETGDALRRGASATLAIVVALGWAVVGLSV